MILISGKGKSLMFGCNSAWCIQLCHCHAVSHHFTIIIIHFVHYLSYPFLLHDELLCCSKCCFFSFLFLCFSLLWLNYFQQNKSALCEFFPQQNFASRVFIVLLPYFNLFVRFICCCLIIPLFIICIPFLFINLFLSLFLSYLYMVFLLPS